MPKLCHVHFGKSHGRCNLIQYPAYPLLRTLIALMKKALAITLTVVTIILLAIPLVSGHFIRQYTLQALAALPDSSTFSLQVQDTRRGWLHSEIDVVLSGEPFVEPGAPGIPLLIELSHGPMIWHLPDSMWALTYLQIRNPEHYTGQGADQYSGSVLLRVNREQQARINGILGFAAFDGDHLLQFNAHWPTEATLGDWRQLMRQMNLTLSIDADAHALLQSPFEDTLRVYHQQRWTRFYAGRALTYVILNDGWLDINGEFFPLGNLLPP